jgi:hypothetical protein
MRLNDQREARNAERAEGPEEKPCRFSVADRLRYRCALIRSLRDRGQQFVGMLFFVKRFL